MPGGARWDGTEGIWLPMDSSILRSPRSDSTGIANQMLFDSTWCV